VEDSPSPAGLRRRCGVPEGGEPEVHPESAATLHTLSDHSGAWARKRWSLATCSTKDPDDPQGLPLLEGAYRGIGSAAEDYPSKPPSYSRALVDEVISCVRTGFDAFSRAEQEVLQNHGYLLAAAAVEDHFQGLVARKAEVGVPYQDWWAEPADTAQFQATEEGIRQRWLTATSESRSAAAEDQQVKRGRPPLSEVDRSCPGFVAAEQVGDIDDSSGREQACRDHRPVAAGTVDDGGSGGIEFAQSLQHASQRDVDGARDASPFQLPEVAHVNDHEVGDLGPPGLQLLRRQTGTAFHYLGTIEEDPNGVHQVPDHVVVADASQTHLDLELRAGLAYHHDALIRSEHGTGVLGEAPAEAHVERAP
jgi:hypothetical protein